MEMDELFKKLSEAKLEENSLFPVRSPILETKVKKEAELPFKVLPLPQHHIDILDNICEYVFAEWSPGKSEIEARAAVAEELGHYVQKIWPSAHLASFGSSCNGFIFKNSDLDLSLRFRNCKSSVNLDEVRIIKTLAKDLALVMSNVTAVTGARVPIVKLVHPRSRIEVDISLYNELGGENSRMLRVYASLDARVLKLGYMVKLLAKTCGIGDASKGSLSSYGHILMMIFYLQQVSPPVVPVLQEMFPPGKEKPSRLVGGWNTWFYAPADVEQFRAEWEGFGRNTMTVGELWLGFLNFYATEFNSDLLVVCIRRYEPLWKQEKEWRSSSLAIEDPFELSHNLGGMSAVMDSFIKKTFNKASKLFRTPLKVNLSGYRDIQHYFFNPELLTEGPPPNQKCRSCGKAGHRSAQCPNVTCRTCGEKGHMADDCRETRQEAELKTAFVFACKNGNFYQFRELCQFKALNINCRNGEGLYWAVRFNHVPIWDTLLDRPDIEVNHTDFDGNTVLHWAGYQNNAVLTHRLLSLTEEKLGENAIKCNKKNKSGDTALMVAASYGNIESLKVMLDCPMVSVFAKRKGKELEETIWKRMEPLGSSDRKLEMEKLSYVQNLIRKEKMSRSNQKLERNQNGEISSVDDTYSLIPNISVVGSKENFPLLIDKSGKNVDISSDFYDGNRRENFIQGDIISLNTTENSYNKDEVERPDILNQQGGNWQSGRGRNDAGRENGGRAEYETQGGRVKTSTEGIDKEEQVRKNNGKMDSGRGMTRQVEGRRDMSKSEQDASKYSSAVSQEDGRDRDRRREASMESPGGNFWECSTCTFHNHDYKNICEMCGKTMDQPVQRKSQIEIQNNDGGGLACDKCTLINQDGAKICEACGATLGMVYSPIIQSIRRYSFLDFPPLC